MAGGNSGDDELSFADRAVATLRGMEDRRASDIYATADFIDRLVARIIDFLVLSAVALAVLVLVFNLTSDDDGRTSADSTLIGVEDDRALLSIAPGPPPARTVVFIGVATAFIIAYEVATAALWGCTAGRSRANIRLVRYRSNDPASLLQVGLRTFIWAFPFVFGVVSFGVSVLYPMLAFGALLALYLWHKHDAHDRPGWDIIAHTNAVNVA